MARKATKSAGQETLVTADGTTEQERESTSSLTKMLSIFDLFTVEKPIWSTADILEALHASRSTGYRYIKALTSAGLLSAVGNGYYMLGSRIMELDLQIRMTDPLLQAGDGVLEQLVDATHHSAILCMLFQNSVLCVRQRRAQLSPKTLFSRGQRRPLFKGAMSRVILAHLPNHRLPSIYARRKDAIREMHLGDTWEEFRDGLAKIRADGYVKTVGEFNPGVVGIGAPIFNGEQAIIGSIGVAFGQDELPDMDLNRIILTVKRAGREVTQRMAKNTTGLGLPPRAVG